MANSESMGRWIYTSTIAVYIVCFCMVYPSASSEPWGELARGQAILFATAILGLGSILASVLLYRNGCRNRLHFVPYGLLGLWIAIFAPLFIGKPYYWSYVSFINRSNSDIWIQDKGDSPAHSEMGFTGVNFGNSSDSITVVWWFGKNPIPPVDRSQVFRYVLKPPIKLPRKTPLNVTIAENGEWSIDSDPPSGQKLLAR